MKTKDVLEIIVAGLVLNPQKVKINEKLTEMGMVYEIECDPNDRKFIIGKKGSTFRALLTIARKIGTKNKQAVYLKIKEENEPKNKK
jgi:predicted RNA-binding protein YlqC (UPF0109 family)